MGYERRVPGRCRHHGALQSYAHRAFQAGGPQEGWRIVEHPDMLENNVSLVVLKCLIHVYVPSCLEGYKN